jgi:hypothetical protein
MTLRAIISYSALLLSFTTLKAQVTDAGPDTSLCVSYYTMQGSPLPAGATGFWALVSGCGTIVNAGSPTTDLNSLCIGTNVFVWYVDDNGAITTDQVAITVFDATIQTASAGVDIQIAIPNTMAMLSANAYAYPCSCQWTIVQGAGVIADPTDPNTYASDLTVGSNIFAWTCDNGACGITSDTMTVEVLDPTGLASWSNSGPVVSFEPFSRSIKVSARGPVKDLRVMDLNGRIIGNNAIDQGLYLATFMIGDRNYGQRIVVTR